MVHWYDSLVSTNTTAAALARDGAPHGTAVAAGTQTGGRGRLGRTWVASPGNLYLSVLLRPDIDPEHLPLITLGTGAVLAEILGEPFRLKWPNDLLDDAGRKVAGILAEAEWSRGRLDSLVVGIGVNVAHAPDGVPATCLADHGRVVGLDDLAERIRVAVAGLDVREVRARWKRRDRTLGREVSIGEVRGTAVDLDADGALVVRTGAGLVRVTTGDLGFAPEVRPAELDDREALFALEHALVADGRGEVRGPEDLPASAADVPIEHVFVGVVDGRVVGSLGLNVLGPRRLRHVARLGIGVHPDHQRRGVGRALLGHAITVAQTRGVHRLELYVRADNVRAIRLYESYGFEVESVRRGFVRLDDGTFVDDLCMVLFASRGRVLP